MRILEIICGMYVANAKGNEIMVNVIGLGYIGLPTALALAANGVEVVGTDINKIKVEQLKCGTVTFSEKGLDGLFERTQFCGIRFENRYVVADYYIVSVPTPVDTITYKVNTEYVISAVKQILEVCPQGAVLIIESTIQPGTIEKQIRPIIKAAGKKIGRDVYLAHAPERIIPGNMIYELQHNSRTIGADSRQIAERVRDLYATFCRGEIVLTDIRSAELSKVVENAYRAVNIAFANELSIICGHENIDVSELIRICNKHPRVNILNPGPGVGGHCISIDPWFLVGEYGEDAALTRCAMETNRRMPRHVLERIQKVMRDNDLEDFNRVGLYGLAYKENVDDCRESPTLQLLAEIKKTGSGTPAVYDPMVLSDLVPHQCHTMDEFLFHSSIVVIMVKHAEILNNMDMLAGKIIIDCHHICKLENTVYL